MSRLDGALARFTAALDRLEACADERIANARESDGAAAVKELSLVTRERERLIAQVASLEDESRNLAGLAEEAETRLDGAISEIRDVLGRN